MPATSSVVGSSAELATLPWLLLVLLRASAGAFKLGVVREEPFAKFFKLCPGFLEVQGEKLCISQISVFEIYVERLKESPRGSSKEVAQAANHGGEERDEGNPFFLSWLEFFVPDNNGFLGGSAHVAIRCNDF